MTSIDLNMFQVKTIPGHYLCRFGPFDDGGYVILDGFTYDMFLSCGVGHNIDFELDFLENHPGLSCHLFDNTINELPCESDRLIWHRQNIGIKSSENNLKSFLKESSSCFLKMDIEGSEFDWIENLLVSDLEKITQMVLELHFIDVSYGNTALFELLVIDFLENVDEFVEYFLKVAQEKDDVEVLKRKLLLLKKITTTHHLVHLHGNNSQGSLLLGDRVIMVPENETSYLKIPLYREYPEETFLSLLDPDQSGIFGYCFDGEDLLIRRLDSDSGWKEGFRLMINGNFVPKVIECTFVLKSRCSQAKISQGPIPGPWDYPSCDKMKDIYLQGYPYFEETKLLKINREEACEFALLN